MKTNSKTAILIATLGFALPSLSAAKAPRDLDRDGIPNSIDPDIDNDGLLNGDDPNVDGGVALSGPLAGRYIGDHYLNGDKRELDIDNDGIKDGSRLELDIDGDGLNDDAEDELDIDGDGLLDDSPEERDTDGDGISNRRDLDDDGDGIRDRDDDDDDGDGHPDLEDDHHDGAVLPLASGPVGDGIAPDELTSLAFILQRGSIREFKKFEFITASSVRISESEHGKVESETSSYTYAANGVSGQVIITHEDEEIVVTLNFALGSFTTKKFEHGRLDETKTGAFRAVLP